MSQPGVRLYHFKVCLPQKVKIDFKDFIISLWYNGQLQIDESVTFT